MAKKCFWIAMMALVTAPHALFAAAYMRTVSWNLRHEGWSGETDYAGDATQIWTKYGSSSGSSNGCDIVFLQEVMYSTVPASIASALTSTSGYTWASAYVGPIGRSSYKEYYAVVYRTDRVTLLSSTMWSDSGDVFEREPQIIKIRDKSTNADYTFINWHSVFGNGGSDIHNEVKQIDNVFSSIQSGSSSDQDVLLVGDTNLNATHSAWNELYALSPAVSNYYNTATTLNSGGSYVSPYDHYFAQPSYVTEISTYGRDYIANTSTFYSGFSDHAPIWLRLYSSSDTD